jgi:hypothetical protein
MAKTAPWFVHYGCVPGLYPDSALMLTAFMPKPTQTPFIAGPLGTIRVPSTETFFYLGNFIVTRKLPSVYQDLQEAWQISKNS